MRTECGGLIFTSDFDSGNLDRVEFVSESTRFSIAERNSSTSLASPNFHNKVPDRCTTTGQCDASKTHKDVKNALRSSRSGQLAKDVRPKLATAPSSSKTCPLLQTPKKLIKVLEFNVWTKPDCAGTPFENPFRSWFHFGIEGCSSQSTVKMNIMNLNRQGKLYFHGMRPVYRIVPGKENWKRIPGKVQYRSEVDGNFVISFSHIMPNLVGSTVYFAFTYPFTYSDCDDMLNHIDKKMGSSLYTDGDLPQENDIYYCRELLCYSLDGRRAEILTITSYKGITKEREEKLPNLFPDESKPRCHIFCDKKIIFVSSRVHPGETPSSFVFNGFLRSLLCPKDPKANRLRNLYVFKLLPMLNPDGVWRGHFRTDSQGINLNRTYLMAHPDLHPTVHASRSLLLYYHTLYASKPPLDDTCDVLKENQNHIFYNNVPVRKSCLLKASSELRLVSPSCSSLSIEDCGQGSILSSNSQPNATASVLSGEVLLDKSLSVSDFCLTSGIKSDIHHAADAASLLRRFPNKIYLDPNSDSGSLNDSPKPILSPTCGSQLSVDLAAFRSCSDLEASDLEEEMAMSPDLEKNALKTSNLISNLDSELSGISYYFDLHGHACKRGCFIYGNHFADIEQKIECMLLSKLMSINCPYFDFAACNFSAENMRSGGKKDGLSKEGSGRVSLHTFTGIIHSYTLECNYNTGRSPIQGDGSPGKPVEYFSPEIYQQVGEALLVSILDASGRNPASFIPHSVFGSVQGVRDWLRNYILSIQSRNKSDFLKKNILSLRMGKLSSKEKSSLTSPTPLLKFTAKSLSTQRRQTTGLRTTRMELNAKRNLKTSPVSNEEFLSNFGMQYKQLQVSNPSLTNIKTTTKCLNSLKTLLGPKSKSFGPIKNPASETLAVPLKKSKGSSSSSNSLLANKTDHHPSPKELSAESSLENLKKPCTNKVKSKEKSLDDIKTKKFFSTTLQTNRKNCKGKKKNITSSLTTSDRQTGPQTTLLKNEGNIRSKKIVKKIDKTN